MDATTHSSTRRHQTPDGQTPRSRTSRGKVRWVRWLLLIVGLALLGLGVLAYQHQATLLRDTANRLLAPYGIEIVGITGLLPGRSRITVAAIDFRYADLPHEQSLRGIRIDYRPTAVLRGFIDEIHIGEARLYSDQWPIPLPEMPGATSATSPARAAPDTPQPQVMSPEPVEPDTPATLQPALPVGKITVDNIQLELAAQALTLQAESHLQLDTFDNGDITLTSGIRDVQLQLSQMELADVALTGLDLRIPELDIECRGLENCRVRGTSDVTISALQQPDRRLADIALSTTFDARYRQGSTTFRTAAPSQLSIGELESGPHSGGLIEFNLQEGLFLSYDPALQLITASLTQLSAALPMLRPELPDNLLGVHIDINGLHGSYQLPDDPDAGLTLENLTLNSDFSISQVYTNMMPYNIWSYRFDQQIRWEAGRVGLQANAMMADTRVVSIEASQDWRTGAGSAQIRVPELMFAADGLTLSQVLSPLPVPADLLAGQVRADAAFTWQLPSSSPSADSQVIAPWPQDLSELALSGPFSVSLINLGGYYMETVFAGLATEFSGELLADGTIRGAGTTPLTIENVDAGIPVNNISANYRVDLTEGAIELRDMRLDLFGGQISSEVFHYDLQRAAGDLLVRIDNIDLSRALSASAYDAVSATGLISGRVPIQIRDMTPVITDGELRAGTEGGTIRYQMEGAGSGNQSLDIVYQALEHYQFEVLEADVDYREDGELLLAVRMQGVSPQLNEGQRINLNLNISDNIPALLESLQAGRSVTDLVERRLAR